MMCEEDAEKRLDEYFDHWNTLVPFGRLPWQPYKIIKLLKTVNRLRNYKVHQYLISVIWIKLCDLVIPS